ncbi:hypothetical protein [Mesorhizobium sp. WSM4311]|uniref:hypothetical protein n=1 Tax=Mesorhizobium sp. WSM4311 TaxID=2029410 RepID=UPI001FDF118B|nr:hypothetical protein [Mesorhizobium sp. WSM4311]
MAKSSTRLALKEWYRSAATASPRRPVDDWLKAKCYPVDQYELLGVERKARRPAFALMADRATGRYVGSAFINSSRPSASGYGSGSRNMPGRRRRG